MKTNTKQAEGKDGKRGLKDLIWEAMDGPANRGDRKRKGPLHSLLSGSPGSSLSNLNQESEHKQRAKEE